MSEEPSAETFSNDIAKGVLIVGISALLGIICPALMACYEAGFCNYFDIPFSAVRLQPHDIIFYTISLFCGLSFAAFFVHQSLDSVSQIGIGRAIYFEAFFAIAFIFDATWISINMFIFFIVGCNLALAVKVRKTPRWLIWIVNTVLVVILLAAVVGRVRLATFLYLLAPAAGYWLSRHSRQTVNRDVFQHFSLTSLTTVKELSLSRCLIGGGFLLLFLGAAAYGRGVTKAMSQSRFSVFIDQGSEFVQLATYGDYVVAKQLIRDGKKVTLDSSYRVIGRDSLGNTSFRPEVIGPLGPWAETVKYLSTIDSFERNRRQGDAR